MYVAVLHDLFLPCKRTVNVLLIFQQCLDNLAEARKCGFFFMREETFLLLSKSAGVTKMWLKMQSWIIHEELRNNSLHLIWLDKSYDCGCHLWSAEDCRQVLERFSWDLQFPGTEGSSWLSPCGWFSDLWHCPWDGSSSAYNAASSGTLVRELVAPEFFLITTSLRCFCTPFIFISDLSLLCDCTIIMICFSPTQQSKEERKNFSWLNRTLHQCAKWKISAEQGYTVLSTFQKLSTHRLVLLPIWKLQ